MGRAILLVSVAFAAAATGAHSRAAKQQGGTGIVGYWRLDQLVAGTPATTPDSSGNNITGSLPNGATASAAAPAIAAFSSGSFAFDGTNQYVDLGNPAQLPAGTAGRSMCGWGRTNVTAGAGYRWIAAYGSPVASQAMFIGQLDDTLVGGGYAGDDVTLAAFWDTGWHHIALTYDGTNARLYADGVLRATLAKNWPLTRSRAYIGRQINDAEYWDGEVDDVRIFNRVLTPEEVAYLGAGNGPPAAPTNLAAGTVTFQSVPLTWTATTTAPPAGGQTTYTVKRSTVNGGPYTTLMSGIAGTAFTDTTMPPNATYYYVVSAVNSAGGEGANSTQIAVVVPPVPPKTTTSGSNNNLMHRCGCNTASGTAGGMTLWAAGVLMVLAFARRRLGGPA